MSGLSPFTGSKEPLNRVEQHQTFITGMLFEAQRQAEQRQREAAAMKLAVAAKEAAEAFADVKPSKQRLNRVEQHETFIAGMELEAKRQQQARIAAMALEARHQQQARIAATALETKPQHEASEAPTALCESFSVDTPATDATPRSPRM